MKEKTPQLKVNMSIKYCTAYWTSQSPVSPGKYRLLFYSLQVISYEKRVNILLSIYAEYPLP